MKLLGHGVDIASISRLKAAIKRQGDGFEKRVFSEAEIHYCRAKADPMPHFAARFAAKEAYGKAMGVGLGASGDLLEVEVVNGDNGEPNLVLSGRAKKLFRGRKGKQILLSLSHDANMAIASVILVGE